MRRFSFIFCLLLLLGLSSCEDFLKQTSQNLVTPTTVSEYKDLLQGEGYFQEFSTHARFINFMTDDMEYINYPGSSPSTSSYINMYQNVYCWSQEIENDNFKDEWYGYLYSQVLAGNICLEYLDEVLGSDAEKKVLRGQASFQRAYAYFLLANTYGEPYDAAKLDEKCIPLTLTATPVTERYERATLGEIWAQIKSDIAVAVECLRDYSAASNFEINYDAALLLAQRVALYMNDYQLATTYGDMLLERKCDLWNISELGPMLTCSKQSNDGPSVTGQTEGFINRSTNCEILWNFGTDDAVYKSIYNVLGMSETELFRVTNYFPADLSHDGSLMSCYENEANLLADTAVDNRKYYYLMPCRNKYVEDKHWTPISITVKMYLKTLYNWSCTPCVIKYESLTNTLDQAFRTAEVYLNQAEAYARRDNPDTSKALELLNTLRRHRIKGYTDLVSSDFTSTDELVAFIFDERRRELCFDEVHRWFDLRRQGCPELTHYWQGGVRFVLHEGDEGYTLAIPAEERSFDASIPNPRPSRTAE